MFCCCSIYSSSPSLRTLPIHSFPSSRSCTRAICKPRPKSARSNQTFSAISLTKNLLYAFTVWSLLFLHPGLAHCDRLRLSGIRYYRPFFRTGMESPLVELPHHSSNFFFTVLFMFGHKSSLLFKLPSNVNNPPSCWEQANPPQGHGRRSAE